MGSAAWICTGYTTDAASGSTESRREEALCSAAAIVIQELSQRAWQRDERQERRLRVGLSALTVLLSGVHLGLTIQYRDHVAGQVLQTMSGIGASVLWNATSCGTTG